MWVWVYALGGVGHGTRESKHVVLLPQTWLGGVRDGQGWVRPCALL